MGRSKIQKTVEVDSYSCDRCGRSEDITGTLNKLPYHSDSAQLGEIPNQELGLCNPCTLVMVGDLRKGFPFPAPAAVVSPAEVTP